MNPHIHFSESFPTADQIVEHCFRHEYGKCLAALARIFGKEHFELIEDAVQEALLKAMQVWPYHALPNHPSAWILAVARNKMIDVLRRRADFQNKRELLLPVSTAEEGAEEHNIAEGELQDDLLKMMFACCHPLLTREQQIVLTLKILCGLSVTELAKALLKKEATVAKIYLRGRLKLKHAQVEFLVPQRDDLQQRLEAVLRILYLLFNEGYSCTDGENLVRKELCREAMRLLQVLLENERCRTPPALALMALMCFQASRLEARTNAAGELLTLREQNRAQWNEELIRWGSSYLAQAAEGESPSAYHFEAAIAACHSLAPGYEATDWSLILQNYDWLLRLASTPIVALNRLVAVAKVHGSAQALQELHKLESDKTLTNYHLLYAIKSELLLEAGQRVEAKRQLETAHRLAKNVIEKKFLEKKLEGF